MIESVIFVSLVVIGLAALVVAVREVQTDPENSIELLEPRRPSAPRCSRCGQLQSECRERTPFGSPQSGR